MASVQRRRRQGRRQVIGRLFVCKIAQGPMLPNGTLRPSAPVYVRS